MNADTTVIMLRIPTKWIKGLNQEQLREALQLGLLQLREQPAKNDSIDEVAVALTGTGQIRPPAVPQPMVYERQTPPTVIGDAVSDILISQRRGEQ